MELYQAMVIDGAPDSNRPGSIKVRIPALFGDVDVPTLIPPLFPGGMQGGWQAVPQPSGDPNDDDRRVLVLCLAANTYRWIGTSQVSDLITQLGIAVTSGMISVNGRHAIYAVDQSGSADGVTLIAAQQAALVDDNARTTVHLHPQDGLIVKAGTTQLRLHSDGTAEVVSPSGASLVMQPDGTITATSPVKVQVVAPLVEAGDGANDWVALATKTNQRFQALESWGGTHVHPDPISGVTGVATPGPVAGASVAATKLKAI